MAAGYAPGAGEAGDARAALGACEASVRLINKEIASRLGVSSETVKTHLKNVFGKLGVADRTQAAIAALRDGIIHFD